MDDDHLDHLLLTIPPPRPWMTSYAAQQYLRVVPEGSLKLVLRAICYAAYASFLYPSLDPRFRACIFQARRLLSNLEWVNIDFSPIDPTHRNKLFAEIEGVYQSCRMTLPQPLEEWRRKVIPSSTPVPYTDVNVMWVYDEEAEIFVPVVDPRTT